MNCYICRETCEIEVVHGTYNYWKCSNCFTSQVLPQLSHAELKEYYDSFHLNKMAGGVYDDYEDRMQADFPAKIDIALRYNSLKNFRLLDVGCGKGYFVKAALERGISAEGIDVSHSGVEYAVNVLGVKAKEGLLEENISDEWQEAFDIVTFWATIEHLINPLSVLEAIHKTLKPGGLIMLDTGLGNVYWEKFLPGHSQWYDAPQHMFVFSEKGLIELLNRAGFKVIHVDNNFERSLLRRWVRWLRHMALCLGGALFISPLLGKQAKIKMKQESKWPIGRLIKIIAVKE